LKTRLLGIRVLFVCLFVFFFLHNHLDAWEISPSSEVIGKLENGVNIRKYFKHFKGNCCDAEEPPMMYFPKLMSNYVIPASYFQQCDI
jgi:hypothetical protein